MYSMICLPDPHSFLAPWRHAAESRLCKSVSLEWGRGGENPKLSKFPDILINCYKKKMRKLLGLNLIFLVITYLIVWYPGSLTSESYAAETFKNVSIFEAKHMIDDQKISLILDVRTDVEYAQSHIRDTVFIPLMVLSKRVHELKWDQRIRYVITRNIKFRPKSFLIFFL